MYRLQLQNGIVTLQSTIELHELTQDVAQKVHLDARRTSANSQQFDHPTGLKHTNEPPANAIEAIPDGRNGWTVVAACSFMLFWINGYTPIWGVLQTAIVISPTLHTNVRTVTFVGSLYMACMVGFGIASIRIMRSFDIRRTSLAAMVVFGLGLIATSFTLEHLAGLFCVAGLLVGFGTSLLYTATNSLPLQWFSSKLGIANGLVKAGGGVSATVLPLAAQALINIFGLKWTFRIFGILIIATGSPCALALKERPSARTLSRSDWSLLKNIPFRTLTMAGAVGVFALLVPPFFLPLFVGSIGLSASTGASLVGGIGSCYSCRPIWGWLGMRSNRCIQHITLHVLSQFCKHVGDMASEYIIAISLHACHSQWLCERQFLRRVAHCCGCDRATLCCGFYQSRGFILDSRILLEAPLAGILIDATGVADAKSIEPSRAAIFFAAGTGVLAMLMVVVAQLRLDKKVLKKL